MSSTLELRTLPRNYDATLSNQTNFRVQVPIERIVLDALIKAPIHTVVPQIVNAGDAWALRGWAVLSMGESLAKTLCALVANIVSCIAEKCFSDDEWNSDVYYDATATYFKSLWLSALMIWCPQDAINQVIQPASDIDPTIEAALMGQDCIPADDPKWGDVGDLSQATVWQKLQLVGTITRPAEDI
jgi:hypothetical protein